MSSKLKLLVALVVTALPVSTFAETLDSFVHSSITSNNKIKVLAVQAETAKLGVHKSDFYFLPSVTALTTANENFKKQKNGDYDFKKNRTIEEQLNMSSLLWSDNVSKQSDIATKQYQVALLNLATESQNITAKIKTTAYSIKIYEDLIQTGETILKRAHSIQRNIKQKVDGGLAKGSDLTTANVLLAEMENAILATKMKINQLKLSLEQVSGSKVPSDLIVTNQEVNSLIDDAVKTDVSGNIELRKKALDKDISRLSVSTATNLVDVSLQAKAKYDIDNRTFEGKDSQVGLNVSLNLFDPSTYWKRKAAVNKLRASVLEYDQLYHDLKINVQSQETILSANMALMDSEKHSVSIKKKLIKQRQDEYEINVTSLYELIQSWNSYYTSMQQLSDTKVTLVNTIMSIKTATGSVAGAK
ncbi:TolC family protein [Photobacterium damselae]|uniref:TolC family protein n=1 Tax=Photobacterium damselae TaxID=38293 RepID=UPI001EED75EB|nr:TolC family protein [Photobacterium damselae]UKA04480.1 TolC family protein [Photobacterium damselae subsp. damselae]